MPGSAARAPQPGPRTVNANQAHLTPAHVACSPCAATEGTGVATSRAQGNPSVAPAAGSGPAFALGLDRG